MDTPKVYNGLFGYGQGRKGAKLMKVSGAPSNKDVVRGKAFTGPVSRVPDASHIPEGLGSMDLPAHTYLEERGIPHRRLAFSPDTEKGAANVALTLGFEEGQMVKTLIFCTGEGEMALVMLGGDRHAISGQLKRAMGSRNVSLADPAAVLELTGYAVGSMPPFHWQPKGFRSLLDSILTEYDELGVGAGQWGNEIIITPANLIAASQAEVVNLTRREP